MSDEMSNLPDVVIERLKPFGGWSPTVHAKERMLKMGGFDDDGPPSYMTSDECRDLANALIIAANWLDVRAKYSD